MDLATDIALLCEDDPVSGWQRVDSSDFARVHAHRERGLYCKQFLPRSRFDIVKSWLRGDRSIRARHRSDDLIAAGFSSPTPVAWGLYARHRGFVVTEAVAAIGVTEWLRTLGPGHRARRWQLLTALGQEIGRLHGAGFVHGDLRTSNVLVTDQDSVFSFYFIDNERNSQHRQIPMKLVVKNLVQLDMLLAKDLSRSDRLRFYKSYITNYGRFEWTEARALAQTVHARSRARLAGKGLA